MNTYRAVVLGLERWGVEWFIDGVSHGIIFSTFENKRDALDFVMLLTVTSSGRGKRTESDLR